MKITSLEQIFTEATRQAAFPVAGKGIFLAHAGVTALPACVADAVIDYTRQSAENPQEFGDVLRRVKDARKLCARTIGAQPGEIALLGPTSLGLSLVANGLDWREGDEIVCYRDDYPANVYPWMEQERRGARVIYLEPERMGEITPELVTRAMTPRTKLVALASCHFLSGYRIDIDAIGQAVHERGALFCLDAIQTIGAFPTRVDHVDFLSADAHKWMLGPLAAGIVYVKEEHFAKLRPSLVGAWNVNCPNFITQDDVTFVETAQRYEPGVLNIAGIFGMHAALEMIEQIGIQAIGRRLLELKKVAVTGLQARGFQIVGPTEGTNASSITTFHDAKRNLGDLFQYLTNHNITTSFRHDRAGTAYLRLSPHFYNTENELEQVLGAIDAWEAASSNREQFPSKVA